MKKHKKAKKHTNIKESVEFLTEEDMLVAELDKRLSFTAVGETKVCSEMHHLCPSFCPCKVEHVPSAVAGTRG